MPPERLDFHRRPRWLVASSSWEETASAEVAKGGAQVSRSTAHLRSVGHEFTRSLPKHVPGWASWRSPSTLSERTAVSFLEEVLRVAQAQCQVRLSDQSIEATQEFIV